MSADLLAVQQPLLVRMVECAATAQTWVGCTVRSIGSSSRPVPQTNLNADPDNPLDATSSVYPTVSVITAVVTP